MYPDSQFSEQVYPGVRERIQTTLSNTLPVVKYSISTIVSFVDHHLYTMLFVQVTNHIFCKDISPKKYNFQKTVNWFSVTLQ